MMIELTQLSGRPIVINIDLVEFVESTPDTLVSLTTGKKILIRESIGEVIERTAAFRRLCQRPEISQSVH